MSLMLDIVGRQSTVDASAFIICINQSFFWIGMSQSPYNPSNQSLSRLGWPWFLANQS